ncbi:hypothetical protein CI102_7960 [Trichoderma harzianum]|nr:hypothetical protein CI102_7960 [Trichoderma harzianum]
MTTVPDPNPTQIAFAEAVRKFKSKLKNDQLYAEILKTKSIDEVYDATDALQAEQAKQGRLRHLSKIKPFLEGLQGYADTIDTFVQVKPDVLALIWGPIKLLIQWAASLTQSIDALANIAAEIGELLPEFKLMAAMFGNNEQMKLVLVLFFQDILDFYVVALKFFGLPHWRVMFEALWPSQKEKIKIVMDHIGRHTKLMRNKVRLEHLREEYEHRQRAFDHFEATQKSNMRQEYNIVKTDISPRFYDAELYRIRGQVCKGTGNWLKQASDFKKWLNGDDDSTRILWLCGIPGAGKTHLAAMAIDFAMSTRTIFVFLSHANSSSTTALSVIHSLIFQLASDDENLQAILCGSNRENFKNSLDVAISFLQTLLNSTGLVSIIIDGVDEIDISEREKLLKSLYETSTACKKTLLLISSRAEHDISAILGQISSTIRVDTHNAASIQMFVDDWAQTWFSAHDFLREDKSEIEGLLAPISLKAKGMFLYAKIMLRSIEELDNLDEIRNELRVLPQDLDEAYGRLFEKIDRKSEIVKKKCRLILGWISCSPIPLTLLELEQALVVTISETSRVSSPLNFVRLCGPIIEVVEGNIQFVHFTVKDRHKIENHIDLTEATLSLAICCIRYLCQDHHSPDISEKDLEAGIKMGNYRLHYYAADTWLSLVTQYLRLNQSQVLSEELITTLHKFYEEQCKQDLSGRTELKEQRYPSELQQFKSRNPNIFCFLRGIAQFQQKCSTSLYHLEQEHYWIDLDLTTTSTISKMLYAQFDKFQCQAQQHTDQCLCSILRRHYGRRLYKCGFFSCAFHRSGFDTRFLRESHQKTHDLPWKFGFISKPMRDRHLELHRAEAQDNSPNNETLMLHPKSDDILPLLFDFVAIDDVGAVEKLPRFADTIKHNDVHELLKFVAHSGSAAMMKLIYEKANWRPTYSNEWYDIISAGVNGQNIESLTVILSDLHDEKARKTFQNDIYRVSKLLGESFTTGSMEVVQAIDTFMKQIRFRKDRDLLLVFGNTGVIKASARCPEREEYLINAWSNHGAAKASSVDLVRILRIIARTTHSIRLARALLQYGINMDERQHDGVLTPLHWAARHDCAEAAEFLKFLLYQGANPSICQGIRDEKCVKNISNWLGISWDELIQKAKEDRERGIQWP